MSYPTLDIPEQLDNIADFDVIASFSGGKDSGAMLLALREAGISFTPVYLDTGWEHRDTYDYVDVVEKHIGQPIVRIRKEVPLPPEKEVIAQEFEARLGRYSSMVRLILHKGCFPSRQMRWCTQELKFFVMREYIAGLDADAVNTIGIRGAESKKRALMATVEDNDDMDAVVWRPMHAWTFEDVVAIHHAHGLPPNPLYFKGAERVGCWPCIMARKSEIAHIGQDDERVGILRDLEVVVARIARARREAAGKEYASDPTWFQGREPTKVPTGKWLCSGCSALAGTKPTTAGQGQMFGGVTDTADLHKPGCIMPGWAQQVRRVAGGWPIGRVIEWAKDPDQTVELFEAGKRDGGCMRWGMCDTGRDHDREEPQTPEEP